MFMSIVGGIVTQLFGEWRDGRENKRQLKQAASEFRQEMARSENSYRTDWELKALEGSGVWMKRLTLALFSTPLVWAYFDPVGVQEYFDVLAEMPEWYLGTYGGMVGSVWGLYELRNLRAGKGSKK